LGSISCPVSFYRAKHQPFIHLRTAGEINHQYGKKIKPVSTFTTLRMINIMH